jgi:16S rRNA (guanine527-N7)-methyltransferase
MLEERRIGHVSEEKRRLLLAFAERVMSENQKYNLTGHSTFGNVLENLVIDSIVPLAGLKVPRGTCFADLGTGAGVPGIPMSIWLEETRWGLFDSNMKKISFIRSFVEEKAISNVDLYGGRVEEFAHDPDLRGRFDFVVSRAMANPFMCCEMGGPLLKRDSFMYLYSSLGPDDLSGEVLRHCRKCGLEPAGEGDRLSLGIAPEGLLFQKVGDTEARYPRRFSVLQREARRFEAAK